MIASRKIDDLHPTVAKLCAAHMTACSQAGIELLITCTYRDNEEQARLYALGRTAPGKKVTNAKPGQSMHNYRVAYDVVPMRHGKPVWGTAGEDGKLWAQVGALGQAAGLEWGGAWESFKDLPHFQYTGGHPLSYFQGGGTL